MNLLIIQNAKLGDMVCTTPLFRCAKENIKDAQLFVMGSALNKELLAGNPHIDEYLITPNNHTELRALVRSKKIDTLIMMSPDPRALRALLFAGPKIIVPRIVGGSSPYATKTYRLFSLFATRVPHRMGSYAPREYLRLLEPLGIMSDDTRKEIFISESAQESVKKLLSEHQVIESDFLVGIAPGVGNKIKVWGGERFARVADALVEKYGAKVVVIGGTADKAEAQKMLQALKNKNSVVDVSEKLSLEELKALIARLGLFISVDTGPIYIAEALGVPTLDIVGPMDEREQPPQGALHAVVVPERAAAALHVMNAALYDKAEARRQAESITPQQVLAAAQALIKKIR